MEHLYGLFIKMHQAEMNRFQDTLELIYSAVEAVRLGINDDTIDHIILEQNRKVFAAISVYIFKV